MASNVTAPSTSYMSPLDADFGDINAQFGQIQQSESTQMQTELPTNIIIDKNIQKKKNNITLVVIIVLFSVLIGGLIFLFTDSKISELVSKYDSISKSSSFLNKDQIDFDSELNFDKGYLLEQMIYKEFSPQDKKKYLNLPDVLKEQLQIDFLINQI